MTEKIQAYLLGIVANIAVQVILTTRELLELLETNEVADDDIQQIQQLIDKIDTIRINILDESQQILNEPTTLRRCRERYAELLSPVEKLRELLEIVTKGTNLAKNEVLLEIFKLEDQIIIGTQMNVR